MSRYTIKVNGDEASVHSTLPNLYGDALEIQGLRMKFCKYKEETLTNGQEETLGPIYVASGDLICPDVNDESLLPALNKIALFMFPEYLMTSTNLSAVRNNAKSFYNILYKNSLIKLPFLSYYDLSFKSYFQMYKNGKGYTVKIKNAGNNFSSVTYYPETDTFSDYDYMQVYMIAKTGNDYPLTIYPNRIVIPSSTENSKKKFAISVNDSGEITATEVTK